MALQIRRGTTADRMNIIPIVGELIWDTSTNSLYIGDGTASGGIPAGTLVEEDVQDIASSMITSGTHDYITFTYSDTLGRLSSTVNLSNYTGVIGAGAFKGSLFADDSGLLIDATTGAVNLNGTVKGHVIPGTDNAYDLGSSANGFKDLYLSGSTIQLGDATITADGATIDLPTGSTLDGSEFGWNVAAEDSTSIPVANGTTLEIRGDDGINTRIEDGAVYVSADITAVRPSVRDDVDAAYITFVGNTSNPSYIGVDLNLRYFSSSDTLEVSNLASLSVTTSNNVTAGNNLIAGNAVVITRNSYSSNVSGFLFSQHHETADSINASFYRTRGSSTAQTSVVNGDDLADISFIGHDGTGQAGGAAISATVEGSVTTGHIPTKLSLATDNGTTLAVRAELSATGTWKVNTVQALAANTALSFGGMVKLASYADETAANAAVSGTPQDGMMYYDTGATKIKGYQNGAWVVLQP